MNRSMTRRAHRAIATGSGAVLLSAVLTGLGCATRYPGPGVERLMRGEFTLRVVNRNIADMRVYVVRGSTPVPVGTVGSMETRAFRLAPAELGAGPTLRLLLEPHASNLTHSIMLLDVQAYDLVELRIENNLRLSRIMRRTPGPP